MNATSTIVLVSLTAGLSACANAHRPNPSPEVFRTHSDTPAPEIAMLRARLAKLQFPQPDGTVARLLPAQARLTSTSIGDRFPNHAGMLALYTYHYALSSEWDLVLRQGHYATGTSTERRDDGAQIVRHQ